MRPSRLAKSENAGPGPTRDFRAGRPEFSTHIHAQTEKLRYTAREGEFS